MQFLLSPWYFFEISSAHGSPERPSYAPFKTICTIVLLYTTTFRFLDWKRKTTDSESAGSCKHSSKVIIKAGDTEMNVCFWTAYYKQQSED